MLYLRSFRGSGETLKREEFEARKKLAENARFQKSRFTKTCVIYFLVIFNRGIQKTLASIKKDLTGFPFLQELAEREEMVRNGKLTV